MIFVGDVAIAPDDQFEQVGFPDYLKSQPISVNLEGAISRSKSTSERPMQYGRLAKLLHRF